MFESSVLSIFKTFVTNMTRYCFNDFVKSPTGIRMGQTLECYRRLGLPGAIGSMDATHVRWDKCPVNLTNLCKGKEGYTTLAFNAIVDHSRFIQYVSRAYFGTSNDIQITNSDQYTRSIMHGLYKDVVYYLYDEDGNLFKCYGGWIIVDGGYPKKAVFVDPSHTCFDRPTILWSEWMESVRKDVECTFEILKQRFRVLRNGIQYQSSNLIENIFKTCCILHNMILYYDKKSLDAWENSVL
jgi:hypothetical protein